MVEWIGRNGNSNGKRKINWNRELVLIFCILIYIDILFPSFCFINHYPSNTVLYVWLPTQRLVICMFLYKWGSCSLLASCLTVRAEVLTYLCSNVSQMGCHLRLARNYVGVLRNWGLSKIGFQILLRRFIFMCPLCGKCWVSFSFPYWRNMKNQDHVQVRWGWQKKSSVFASRPYVEGHLENRLILHENQRGKPLTQ